MNDRELILRRSAILELVGVHIVYSMNKVSLLNYRLIKPSLQPHT